jgi:hypothetical protein
MFKFNMDHEIQRTDRIRITVIVHEEQNLLEARSDEDVYFADIQHGDLAWRMPYPEMDLRTAIGRQFKFSRGLQMRDHLAVIQKHMSLLLACWDNQYVYEYPEELPSFDELNGLVHDIAFTKEPM